MRIRGLIWKPRSISAVEHSQAVRYCVANRLQMLTYSFIRSALQAIRALFRIHLSALNG